MATTSGKVTEDRARMAITRKGDVGGAERSAIVVVTSEKGENRTVTRVSWRYRVGMRFEEQKAKLRGGRREGMEVSLFALRTGYNFPLSG